MKYANNCCVYGCKWLRNANYNLTKYTVVCEKQFTIEEISRFHVIGDKQVSTGLYIYFMCVYYIPISLYCDK